MYINWDVNPEIIRINSFAIGYYNFLFVGGIIISYLIVKKIFKKERIPEEILRGLLKYCFIGIVLGARLGHCLFYEPQYYLHHPIEMLFPFSYRSGELSFGYRGLASHGGTIGLIIAIVLYHSRVKMNLLQILDHIAIVAPLGGMCIRLGNLMNSEIIGKPTSVPWAFIFTHVDHIPRHPAQLYEAIAYLLIFIMIYSLYTKKKEVFKSGFFFGLSILAIFTFRFMIEFLKENQVDFESSISLDMGQLLSIPFIIIGTFFMLKGSIVKIKN
ncbi:Prolipoprotein diacylglyceryl transferase [Tannerella forsythia]|nr:Prolipoprotein diacylglyceryl transferase [Tannerella forsythia]